MKVTISVSAHPVNDKDVLDVLGEQSNVSAYIRKTVRYYEANKNDAEDLETREMMEQILAHVQRLSSSEIHITTARKKTPRFDPKNPAPKVSGLQAIKTVVDDLAKEADEEIVDEEKDSELKTIVDKMDNNFGKV